jgi:hypothetical protein
MEKRVSTSTAQAARRLEVRCLELNVHRPGATDANLRRFLWTTFYRWPQQPRHFCLIRSMTACWMIIRGACVILWNPSWGRFQKERKRLPSGPSARAFCLSWDGKAQAHMKARLHLKILRLRTMGSADLGHNEDVHSFLALFDDPVRSDASAADRISPIFLLTLGLIKLSFSSRRRSSSG